MSLQYLLDTNIISEPLKLESNKQVLQLIEKYQDKIALPSFVVYEVINGAYKLPVSAKRKRILNYVEQVMLQLPVLDYTQESAIWHGEEMARLQSLGQTASFLDSQIASVAKVNNLVLVTRNISDFKNFEGLDIVNWFN